MIESDYLSSVEFLRRLRPGGPWTLVAIREDQKDIKAETFHEEGGALKWIADWNDRRYSVYYHVAPLTKDLQKKGDREHVARMEFLHVDVDPRVGELLADEHARILEKFQSFAIRPSCLIFSGGGFNALWRLTEAVEVGGSVERCEELKLYNLQLEILLGGDNCHDLSRILRLPGTVNWPTAKKRAKGRTEALAKVVWFGEEKYPLARFTAARPIQPTADSPAFGGEHVVRISGNVRRFASADEIPGALSEPTKALIVQGKDPDCPPEKVAYSRSEWLFAACCAMVRGGCDDDTIYSVITDPDFLISASVLDKGSGVERYAKRQIQNAREEAVDPDLRRMNERHAVLASVGGKCRVLSEVVDQAIGRTRLAFQSFEDLRNRYMHLQKEVGKTEKGVPSFMRIGDWWLEHVQRRQYEGITFAPGGNPPGMYNLWRGFACNALPGDCSLYLAHLRDVVCSGDGEWCEYLLSWMARTVQQPAEPGAVAVVLQGGQGTGKGTTVKHFGSLWGRHFVQISDAKHLVGSFNAHLRDCVVLFADEAFFAGDKKHEGTLKSLITERTIAVEAKGVDMEMSSNCVHLLMASNSHWVVPAGVDDRRFFVLGVSDAHAEDHPYFAAIQSQMDTGGREALLHTLLTKDISQFNVRNVPKTPELRKQKVYSLSTEDEWWVGLLKAGRLRPSDAGWSRRAPEMELAYSLLKEARAFGRRTTQSQLEVTLERNCPVGWPKREIGKEPITVHDVDGKETTIPSPTICVFPSLVACRQEWDDRTGQIVVWQPPVELEESGPTKAPF